MPYETGPIYASSVASVSLGNIAWLNPTNAQGAPDAALATCVFTPLVALSDALACTFPPILFPSGATLVGLRLGMRASLLGVGGGVLEASTPAAGPFTMLVYSGGEGVLDITIGDEVTNGLEETIANLEAGLVVSFFDSLDLAAILTHGVDATWLEAWYTTAGNRRRKLGRRRRS